MAFEFQEVGTLEGLETKVVVAEVPVIDDGRVQRFCVGLDDLHDVISDEGRWCSRHRISVGVQIAHDLREGLVRGLVQIGYGNA